MSATTDPGLRIQALARANQVRSERARLLSDDGGRRGATGRYSGSSRKVPPEALMGMRIDRLLFRARGCSWEGVALLLDAEGITGTRLVRELTVRQRAAIAERLGG